MRRLLALTLVLGVAAYVAAPAYGEGADAPKAGAAGAADDKKDKEEKPTPEAMLKEIKSKLGLPDDTQADNLVEKLYEPVAAGTVVKTKPAAGPQDDTRDFMDKVRDFSKSPTFYWGIMALEAIIILWLFFTRKKAD